MAKPPATIKDFAAYGPALREEILPLLQQAFTIAQGTEDPELLLIVRSISCGLELVSLGMPILGGRLEHLASNADELRRLAAEAVAKAQTRAAGPDSSGELPGPCPDELDELP
jgi:hypothetical protein